MDKSQINSYDKKAQWIECLVGDDINSVQSQIGILGSKIAIFNFLNNCRVFERGDAKVEISKFNNTVEEFFLNCYFESCTVSLVKLWNGSKVVHDKGECSLKALCEEISIYRDIIEDEFVDNYNEFLISLKRKSTILGEEINYHNIKVSQFFKALD